MKKAQALLVVDQLPTAEQRVRTRAVLAAVHGACNGNVKLVVFGDRPLVSEFKVGETQFQVHHAADPGALRSVISESRPSSVVAVQASTAAKVLPHVRKQFPEIHRVCDVDDVKFMTGYSAVLDEAQRLSHVDVSTERRQGIQNDLSFVGATERIAYENAHELWVVSDRDAQIVGASFPECHVKRLSLSISRPDSVVKFSERENYLELTGNFTVESNRVALHNLHDATLPSGMHVRAIGRVDGSEKRSQRVNYLGFVDNGTMLETIRHAKASLCIGSPSGLQQKLWTALRHGTPVICTREIAVSNGVAGELEPVQHGVHKGRGVLVLNNIKYLGAAATALSSKDLWNDLSEQGSTIAARITSPGGFKDIVAASLNNAAGKSREIA